MAASRKSTGSASRKTPFARDTGLDDVSIGLKDSNNASLLGKKRLNTEMSDGEAEPITAKARRGAEKDNSLMSTKMEDSPNEVSLDFGSLPGPRIGDCHAVDKTSRDALGKQTEELADFVKELIANRRRAARDAAKDQSSKPLSEANKAEALQACDETLMKERAKLQQMFNKLQDAFQESQSTLEDYKVKIRDIKAQEEKDQAWLKQVEKDVEEQLSELLSNALKNKVKKQC